MSFTWSRLDNSPIANSHVVVPPLLSQYLLEQERMLSHMHTVDLVVAGHQRPGIRLSNGNLKWLEVDLPQRSLRDFRAVLVLLQFLLVAKIMLWTSGLSSDSRSGLHDAASQTHLGTSGDTVIL